MMAERTDEEGKLYIHTLIYVQIWGRKDTHTNRAGGGSREKGGSGAKRTRKGTMTTRHIAGTEGEEKTPHWRREAP